MSKPANLSKEEEVAHDLFRIADKYIWMEDFVNFQAEVKKILKENHGIDLQKIYPDSPRKNHTE